jgi:hypothetical protein
VLIGFRSQQPVPATAVNQRGRQFSAEENQLIRVANRLITHFGDLLPISCGQGWI